MQWLCDQHSPRSEAEAADIRLELDDIPLVPLGVAHMDSDL